MTESATHWLLSGVVTKADATTGAATVAGGSFRQGYFSFGNLGKGNAQAACTLSLSDCHHSIATVQHAQPMSPDRFKSGSASKAVRSGNRDPTVDATAGPTQAHY